MNISPHDIARVYLLIDARHGLKPKDNEVLESLDKAAVNYQIVLTKTDEVKDLAPVLAQTQTTLAGHPAAFPAVLATSSHTGDGIAELRAAIARLLRERGLAQ